MIPTVLPQLVTNNGPLVLRAAIAYPDRYACEPKVDGVLRAKGRPGRVDEIDLAETQQAGDIQRSLRSPWPGQ